MQLLTASQLDQLKENGLASREMQAKGHGSTPDHVPVVKLFVPWAAGTWLISEVDPDEPDLAFGLADLGMQCPELGYINLGELRSVRKFGMGIERDLHCELKHPLSVYARAARSRGSITLEIRECDLTD